MNAWAKLIKTCLIFLLKFQQKNISFKMLLNTGLAKTEGDFSREQPL